MVLQAIRPIRIFHFGLAPEVTAFSLIRRIKSSSKLEARDVVGFKPAYRAKG